MNFLELAKLRYSVRSYKNAPVEEAKMNYIIPEFGISLE